VSTNCFLCQFPGSGYIFFGSKNIMYNLHTTGEKELEIMQPMWPILRAEQRKTEKDICRRTLSSSWIL